MALSHRGTGSYCQGTEKKRLRGGRYSILTADRVLEVIYLCLEPTQKFIQLDKDNMVSVEHTQKSISSEIKKI